MAYCTRAELENRFGSSDIADLEYGRPGAVDAAITGASSLIDSYVAGRYALPLAEVPPVLANAALDLVRYALDVAPSDVVIQRRADAVKFLEALAQGRATLGVSQESEPESMDTAEMQNDGHVFSRANTRGFI
ncbi:gp436 family protein [Oceanospirillum sp.]|uniref:gp436 family protein n=1 Tax=Oceanospirillum sp. TaxID=2021254 RepID=UPI003A92E13C